MVGASASAGSPPISDAESAEGRAHPKTKAAPKAEAKASAKSEPIPRAERMQDIRFSCSAYGDIRYNVKATNLVAHCSFHSGNCRRTRTVKPPASSRGRAQAAQGRPLGLLKAWLDLASDYASAAEHSALCRPSLQQRQAARASLLASEGGAEFSRDYEREKGPDEDDEPPGMT